MRVVAGSARGRRLVAPPGTDTRPTSDRVREAIFNVLFSMGGVDDCEVLDLFAGSGALGIEALSRGASRAAFIDVDRRAVAVVEENLEVLGFGERASVHRADVLAWLGTAGSIAADIVFADPPYRFEGWPALLDALGPHLGEGATLVLESDREVDLVDGLQKRSVKSYGGTVVTFARADRGPSTHSGAPS